MSLSSTTRSVQADIDLVSCQIQYLWVQLRAITLNERGFDELSDPTSLDSTMYANVGLTILQT